MVVSINVVKVVVDYGDLCPWAMPKVLKEWLTLSKWVVLHHVTDELILMMDKDNESQHLVARKLKRLVLYTSFNSKGSRIQRFVYSKLLLFATAYNFITYTDTKVQYPIIY
ncbi:hypothetical protein VNO78_03488 [Psophocarpus tetragonolobus]|uniref:Uncharacterized protein n=1 Tax=Psophocarpus tetragonolobus TaxID=3891 RepID=A0AAN9T4F1_PSOTE